MPRNFARNLNRHSDGSNGRYREDDENARYAQADDERAVLESEDEVEKTDQTVSEARATQRSRR